MDYQRAKALNTAVNLAAKAGVSPDQIRGLFRYTTEQLEEFIAFFRATSNEKPKNESN